MTAPANTRRAVVDASHPVVVAGAGRMRSSLKTVIRPPLLLPRQVVLVGAWRGWIVDSSRVEHDCSIGRRWLPELSKIINILMRE